MNHAGRFHKYILLLLTIILMFGVLLMQCSCDVSEPHSVAAPDTPSGPSTGYTGEVLEYTTGGSTCSQDHEVEYRFDWDDGTLSGWGVEVLSHCFESAGTYTIRAQARCMTKTSIKSGWSGRKSVVIEESLTGTVTGNDGTVYQTVKIGRQWWMAENLKETKYRNGATIPNVTDNTEWTGLSTGARCLYNNSESTAETYGYLYNWFAAVDARNIAPSGWRVPTDDDWKQLEMFLGMSWLEVDDAGGRGTDEGGKLKEAGISHWNSPNTGATNEGGFTALPGGYRYGSNGSFYPLGYVAYFWSATEYGVKSYGAWYRLLSYDGSGVTRNCYDKRLGFSVRLIREY